MQENLLKIFIKTRKKDKVFNSFLKLQLITKSIKKEVVKKTKRNLSENYSTKTKINISNFKIHLVNISDNNNNSNTTSSVYSTNLNEEFEYLSEKNKKLASTSSLYEEINNKMNNSYNKKESNKQCNNIKLSPLPEIIKLMKCKPADNYQPSQYRLIKKKCYFSITLKSCNCN